MAKEAFYFSHDFGARNDPKLQKVLMKLGQEGKGVYWDLIEMLFEEGGKLLLSECDSYAFALRTKNECIASLINDFDLFKKDRKYFWSESVNKRINEREEKSNKARSSAKSRWENANASKSNANAMQQQVNRNAIKEKKRKEKKGKENIYSDFPFFQNGFAAVWDDFLKMRTAIKKVATPEAEKLALEKLAKLSGNNKEIATKIVQQSILNSWQGLFELKEDRVKPQPKFTR